MYETKLHYCQIKVKPDKHDTSTTFETGLSLALKPFLFSVYCHYSFKFCGGQRRGPVRPCGKETPDHLKTKMWSQKARRLAQNDRCLTSSLAKAINS